MTETPFRDVHRAARRRTLAWGAVGTIVLGAVALVSWVLPAAAAPVLPAADSVQVLPEAQPVPAEDAVPAEGALPDADAVPEADAPPQPDSLPEPQSAPVPVSTPTPSSSPLSFAAPEPVVIGIDTSGYQAEIDRCLWVRMDLAGASAPIVGAHNTCGGDVVLDVESGDLVTLTGEGLDGRYIVVGSRDGRPGQDAGEATEGLGATVILQTCYFDGPDVRLVSLVRVG